MGDGGSIASTRGYTNGDELMITDVILHESPFKYKRTRSTDLHRRTAMETYRRTDKETNRQREREGERETNRQADRQTNRQKEID